MAAAVVGMAEMVAAALTCIRVVAIVVAAELILPAVAAAVVVAIVDNRRTFGPANPPSTAPGGRVEKGTSTGIEQSG
jgi:hypothetical protein